MQKVNDNVFLIYDLNIVMYIKNNLINQIELQFHKNKKTLKFVNVFFSFTSKAAGLSPLFGEGLSHARDRARPYEAVALWRWWAGLLSQRDVQRSCLLRKIIVKKMSAENLKEFS